MLRDQICTKSLKKLSTLLGFRKKLSVVQNNRKAHPFCVAGQRWVEGACEESERSEGVDVGRKPRRSARQDHQDACPQQRVPPPERVCARDR